jgi:serine/threonine protein kinase
MPKSYGKWKVVRSLSEGGQGYLFLVQDTTTDGEQVSVLKRLKNPKRLDLFEREVKVASLLSSSNILRIKDVNLFPPSNASMLPNTANGVH